MILGAFWKHFGSQEAFKNRVKFWMRFWRPKGGLIGFFGVGPAECAGCPGGRKKGGQGPSWQEFPEEKLGQEPGLGAGGS